MARFAEPRAGITGTCSTGRGLNRASCSASFRLLVHAEILHYGYAVIMLAGIRMLLIAFVGRARHICGAVKVQEQSRAL